MPSDDVMWIADRAMLGFGSLETLWQDLRYGLRLLARNPGFTAVAAVALALGMGANTAIFSVINAVVLRPFPYKDPDRLYVLTLVDDKGRSAGLSPPDFLAWRERTQVFEGMATYWMRSVTLTGVEEPERLFAQGVTRDCFPMLGIEPLLGRWFTEDEFRPAAPRVVLMGHALWQRRFGGNREIVGKQITLDGESYTVIGVMPPGFQFPNRVFTLWLPWDFEEDRGDRRARNYNVVARLKPDATFEQARAEADTLFGSLAREFPETNSGWQVSLSRYGERSIAEFRSMLVVLAGAVGFVLLIACLNVANLLLARGSEREKEMAIRAALGAGPLRLVRQLLTESVLLAGLGGTLGLLLAGCGVRGLVAMFPGWTVPRMEQASTDGRVLAFTCLVTLVTGIAFGLAPALQAVRGWRRAVNTRRQRLGSVLVISQVALTLVLLTGAGLLIRSFVRLLAVDPGFRAEKVLTIPIPAPSYVTADRAGKIRQAGLYREILQRVEALPGVETTALTTVLPLGPIRANTTFRVENRPAPAPNEDFEQAQYRAVSPAYFRAMGIPLLRGRFFSESDTAQSPGVVIVNESMARHYWPGDDPIGKRLAPAEGGSGFPLSVVGVVGDVKHASLSGKAGAELYYPYLQSLGILEGATLVVRTYSDPLPLAATVRKEIRAIQPDLPVGEIRTMERLVAESVSQPRLYTLVLGLFAAIALLLALAGLYGVISYSVSRRTREIGIRMALGAGRPDILRHVLGPAAAMIGAGVGIGWMGAAALTRVLRSLLFEVSPTDPVVFIGTAAVLGAVALGTGYLAARKASAVDPAVALRHD